MDTAIVEQRVRAILKNLDVVNEEQQDPRILLGLGCMLIVGVSPTIRKILWLLFGLIFFSSCIVIESIFHKWNVFLGIPKSVQRIIDDPHEAELLMRLLKRNQERNGSFSGAVLVKVTPHDSLIVSEPDKNKTAGSVVVHYLKDHKPFSLSLFLKFQTGRGMPIWLQALRAAAEYNVVREIDFYTIIAPSLPIRTVKCYVAEKRPWVNRIFLALEHLDLKDNQSSEGFYVINDGSGANIEHVSLMMKNVAKMHAMYVDRITPMDAQTKWIPARQGITFTDFVKSFHDKNHIWSIEIYNAIAKYFENSPVTLIHGDCRPGNMIFEKKKNNDLDMIFADWEAVNIGPILWDFTYCTTLGWSNEMRKTHLDKVLNLYLESLKEHYVGANGDKIPSFSLAKEQVDILVILLAYVARTVRIKGFWEKQGNTMHDKIAWTVRISLAVTRINTQKLSQVLDLDISLLERLVLNAQFDAKEAALVHGVEHFPNQLVESF